MRKKWKKRRRRRKKGEEEEGKKAEKKASYRLHPTERHRQNKTISKMYNM